MLVSYRLINCPSNARFHIAGSECEDVVLKSTVKPRGNETSSRSSFRTMDAVRPLSNTISVSKSSNPVSIIAPNADAIASLSPFSNSSLRVSTNDSDTPASIALSAKALKIASGTRSMREGFSSTSSPNSS